MAEGREDQRQTDLELICRSEANLTRFASYAPRPGDELAGACVAAGEGPSDWFWLDHELELAREDAAKWRDALERDRLAQEILAGGGPLLDFHRGLHRLRVERDRVELRAVA